MFNTYITKSQPYDKTVTIHEHRAPTDDSIKLLNEFQDKALQNLIKTVPIKNNIIDGIVFLFESNVASYSRKFIFRFKINGIEYQIEDEYEIGDLIQSTYDNSYLPSKVINKLSQIIAMHLFKDSTNFWSNILNIK